MTSSKALLKMGHRCMPKGRSSVGMGICSKSVAGDDVAMADSSGIEGRRTGSSRFARD